MTNLIQKIKAKGYWKVTIHPNQFKDDLISSRSELIKIIEDNKLSLRGWDYPHIDHNIGNISKDSIESSCDWAEGPVFEYWRYYQSGQFVHYFGLREDYRLSNEYKKNIINNFIFHEESIQNVDKFLDIIGTIYTLTEIFEFASRLAQGGHLGDSITIEIELHGVKGRLLYFSNSLRHLNMPYICQYENDVIQIKKEYSKDDIIKNAHEYALNEAINLFKDFNWSNASKNVFTEDQKKFLERRI